MYNDGEGKLFRVFKKENGMTRHAYMCVRVYVRFISFPRFALKRSCKYKIMYKREVDLSGVNNFIDRVSVTCLRLSDDRLELICTTEESHG